jgi:hypothetical protein
VPTWAMGPKCCSNRNPEGLPVELTDLITAVLDEQGYESQPRHGLYHALPLTAADEVWAQLPDRLQALTPMQTIQGPGLLLRDVETAVQQVTAVERISPWQLENLIVAGPVGQMLARLGYRTRITWCQPHHFQPPLDGHGSVGVLIREVRVEQQANKKIGLALPLLPEWSDYLWQHGRQQRLITLLDDGKGQGYAAWQVKPAPSTWQEVVQTGIVSGQIAF